jgi:hypothetical protein
VRSTLWLVLFEGRHSPSDINNIRNNIVDNSKQAVRERIERVRRSRSKRSRADELDEIAMYCAALLVQNRRPVSRPGQPAGGSDEVGTVAVRRCRLRRG